MAYLFFIMCNKVERFLHGELPDVYLLSFFNFKVFINNNFIYSFLSFGVCGCLQVCDVFIHITSHSPPTAKGAGLDAA